MLRLKATKTSLYKLVREHTPIPPMKRVTFTKAPRRPDYWLDWTDANGLRWRAFLAACGGRAKLTLMRENYSGCLRPVALYTMDANGLQARGMVEEFVTAAERRRAEGGAACGDRTHYQMEVTKMIMRIKEHRERAGMTQSQFGAATGVSPAVVMSWESETYLPKARQIPLLAQVLGCPIEDLFVPMEDSG